MQSKPQGLKESSAFRTIKVLYEDDYYVAFDKPPGLLVIPTPKKEKNTLVTIVNAVHLSTGASGRLHPCHRLDRDTSGIILFAKGKKNQQLLMNEFRKRTIQKKYIALVHGNLQRRTGEIRGMISDFDGQEYSQKKESKLAVTRYQVAANRNAYSILEVYPLTGRTNQIRIQLCQIGHPLLGERKYAFARDFTIKFRRCALHANELTWPNPINRAMITVKSPLPKDMQDFIDKN